MGRAGIEPATLGLKVVPRLLVIARARWPKGVVEPNQLACSRMLWRGIVDLLLTELVACSDNDAATIRDGSTTICRCSGEALVLLSRSAFRPAFQSSSSAACCWARRLQTRLTPTPTRLSTDPASPMTATVTSWTSQREVTRQIGWTYVLTRCKSVGGRPGVSEDPALACLFADPPAILLSPAALISVSPLLRQGRHCSIGALTVAVCGVPPSHRPPEVTPGRVRYPMSRRATESNGTPL